MMGSVIVDTSQIWLSVRPTHTPIGLPFVAVKKLKSWQPAALGLKVETGKGPSRLEMSRICWTPPPFAMPPGLA
jgi:hypothetical protein